MLGDGGQQDGGVRAALLVVAAVGAVSGRLDCVQGCEQGAGGGDLTGQNADDGRDACCQGLLWRQVGQCLQGVGRVERVSDHDVQEFLFAREDAEDRAFGDAGRARHLGGGEARAVLDQQRAGGLDDRSSPFIRWQWSGSGHETRA